jgi:hypothetical protein
MEKRAVALFGAMALALAGLVNAAQAERGEAPAAAALAKLKSLAGEWRGENPKGQKTTLSYRTIAGGTAVLEEFRFAGSEQSMLTIYHLDGERLMLTHYCISNNQPRMRAELPASEPDVLRFVFLDATNLASPGDGHMHRAMIRFIDENHIANEWTFSQGGKDQFSEGARYERVSRGGGL